MRPAEAHHICGAEYLVPALFASCGTQAAGCEERGASVLRGPDTVKSKPKHKTRGRPQGMKGIAWACFIKIKRRRNLFHSPPLLRSPKRRGLPPWRKLACFQAVAAGGPSDPDGSEIFTQALPGFAGGFQVRPPAKLGACVSPERVYRRQASQEARNTLSPASPAPPPVNGLLPIICCILLVLNIISLRSKLTVKAFYSTRHSRGVSFR